MQSNNRLNNNNPSDKQRIDSPDSVRSSDLESPLPRRISQQPGGSSSGAPARKIAVPVLVKDGKPCGAGGESSPDMASAGPSSPESPLMESKYRDLRLNLKDPYGLGASAAAAQHQAAWNQTATAAAASFPFGGFNGMPAHHFADHFCRLQ
uniref:Uncharacterized protein n=1 Tax=Romanomermis culicivorax TaxID=13658 RepID=A0A915KRV4_ROMCU